MLDTISFTTPDNHSHCPLLDYLDTHSSGHSEIRLSLTPSPTRSEEEKLLTVNQSPVISTKTASPPERTADVALPDSSSNSEKQIEGISDVIIRHKSVPKIAEEQAPGRPTFAEVATACASAVPEMVFLRPQELKCRSTPVKE